MPRFHLGRRTIPLAASALAAALLVPPALALLRASDEPAPAPSSNPAEPHRSPAALAITADGSRAMTANQTSGTVSWIDLVNRRVLSEIPTGDKPSGVALDPAGRRAVVAHWYGYDVAVLERETGSDQWTVAARVDVGPEPRGVVLSPDASLAYVAVGVANEVVRVDLASRAVTGRLAVGREPRGLALSPDGARLAVSHGRQEDVAIVDLASWTVLRLLPMQGVNQRQIAFSPSGDAVYVANMKNRGFATTRNNIDLGWVLGQRIARVDPDGEEPFATMTLDPQGKAAADVHGLDLSPDGALLAASCGGTRELMFLRQDVPGKPLPWRARGSRDLMPEDLVHDPERFRRVPLGGRPLEIRFSPDGRLVHVVNYLLDSLQTVDVATATLVSEIPLGGPAEPSLERRGEFLFHDASRSFNQWYSCNTCHSDGHTNGQNFDTMNDGWHDLSSTPKFSKKKVPTLRGVAHTGPWTWHGWQTSLDEAMAESFTKSMQGPPATPDEVRAIVAFISSLEHPRNPHRAPDGRLTEQQKRGEAVFKSAKAACNTCHGGPHLTDGKIHIVGLEERRDVYKGYNPPSLRGVYDKDPYLHDGRARTLRDALAGPHNPEDVTGIDALDEQELEDLIAYLLTL